MAAIDAADSVGGRSTVGHFRDVGDSHEPGL